MFCLLKEVKSNSHQGSMTSVLNHQGFFGELRVLSFYKGGVYCEIHGPKGFLGGGGSPMFKYFCFKMKFSKQGPMTIMNP